MTACSRGEDLHASARCMSALYMRSDRIAGRMHDKL